MSGELGYRIRLDTVASGYDRRKCWVQARAGVIPPSTAVITTQKLRPSASIGVYLWLPSVVVDPSAAPAQST